MSGRGLARGPGDQNLQQTVINVITITKATLSDQHNLHAARCNCTEHPYSTVCSYRAYSNTRKTL